MQIIIKENRAFWSFFIYPLLFFILTSCKEKIKTPNKVIEKHDNIIFDKSLLTIKKYYDLKGWIYPVEVDSIYLGLLKTSIKKTDTLNLRLEIINWLKKDRVYIQNESARISNIKLNILNKRSSFDIVCIIDFYKPGRFENKLIVPIEGHGIVEGSFYVEREKAFLLWKDNKISFIKWNN